jgi:hypothetical protein
MYWTMFMCSLCRVYVWPSVGPHTAGPKWFHQYLIWVFMPCILVGAYKCFRGRLVSTYKSTHYYNPEDQHWHLCQHENLRSLNFVAVVTFTLVRKTHSACKVVHYYYDDFTHWLYHEAEISTTYRFSLKVTWHGSVSKVPYHLWTW